MKRYFRPRLFVFLLGAALVLPAVETARADQLDEVVGRPAGVLVQVDPETKTVHVYKAATLDPRIKTRGVSQADPSTNDGVMESEIERVARPENLVAELRQKPASELDQETSTPACWNQYWGSGWGWSGWGGYYATSYWSNPWYSPGRFSYGGYGYGYGCGYGYGYYGGFSYARYGWYW